MGDPYFDTLMGRGPERMLHMEHWSNPDAETYLTGIDYYEHPKLCRERLRELYPQLGLGVPETDAPKPRPKLSLQGETSDSERHTVRWGDGETGSYLHGEAYFHSADEVFAFSPLEHADFTAWRHVVMDWDFSSEEVIYQRLRPQWPAEWGDTAPEGSAAGTWFYNTTFMWPMLTFGWELFLECCLDPRFERIMDEFAELNRRVFRAFARLPVRFITCHDDIVMSNGPVCSPAWMNKYVFPRYEEYWSILKEAGKEVIFMTDGCADAFVDDVMACGARGFISEPYTDYQRIARRYENCVLAGEGDNRILSGNDPAAIRRMVEQMVETGRLSGGYFMCIGNHLPWNVPGEAIKLYLDLSSELAYR
ncbi:MAG: uroporphyrinogen decarboxylase family protein [Armatimonadota bacterium]